MTRVALPTAGKTEAFFHRYFSLVFAVLALPFVLRAASNIAVPLRFEDALIVLRYARNLVEGHGFVFNPGERILGVTTPLHTLISALWVSLSPEHAPAIQNVSGVIFLALEAWLAARLVARVHGAVLGSLAAVLLLTNLGSSYLYFGMETHFFAFLVLLSYRLFAARRETATGVVLGVAFLTRYDAALLALLVGLALLAERKRLPVKLTVAFFAVVTPWLLFSWGYFHTLVPNALGAKKGFYPAIGYLRFVFEVYLGYFRSLAGVFTSSETVQGAAAWLFPVLCFLGVLRLAKAARDALVLVAFAALQVLVYAALGPDPAFRWHYYLLNPVLTVLFLVGLYELAAAALRAASRGGRVFPPRAGRALVTLATLAALALALVSLHRSLDYTFELDPHSRQLFSIAEWLDERYGADTSLLQPSIGILGYATDLRLIDHAGLVTPGLYYYDSTRHTPMAEVLERFAPDLVLVPVHEAAPVAGHGYRHLATFRDPQTYRLYEREPGSADSHIPVEE